MGKLTNNAGVVVFEGDIEGVGDIPDPITDPLNVATTDASQVPLKITLPADFDQGAYDAIEVENSDGLRLFTFDVNGNLFIAANPTLGTPISSFTTDGSAARINLQQGSNGADAAVFIKPAVGRTASLTVANADGSESHHFVSGAVAGAGVVGFYGHAAVARQTGVAVNAGAIHAALVNLGLITA